MFLDAVDADVRFGDRSDRGGVVQRLQQGVGVGIQDVGLQPRVLGVVVEAGISFDVLRLGYPLEVKVFHAELGVLDLDFLVVPGHAVR